MLEKRTLTRENFTLFFGGDKTNGGEFERFAGLPVTITENAEIVGFGHLSQDVFLPAAIHLFLTEVDDGSDDAELLSFSEHVTHGWAVVGSYTNADEWEISRNGVDEHTPGAFPVTFLDL